MKVLKIGASWCPGCKIMVPRWEEVEKEYPWLETEMIKIDDHPEIMKEYQLHQLPTFIFLNQAGEEIERLTGEVEKEILVKAVLENKDK
jgi:thiol-disulfide isomerase/thioredoxin